jgi:hypothetical protein
MVVVAVSQKDIVHLISRDRCALENRCRVFVRLLTHKFSQQKACPVVHLCHTFQASVHKSSHAIALENKDIDIVQVIAVLGPDCVIGAKLSYGA